ncbi:Uncharacterised protein [Mycobacteroides abscessus subsp. abscessus]|nr:Uncharacterised protein [Mycobacteroides abscessus subsp. abscessus]
MAEPMPALSAGTTAMIDSVAGTATEPMPRPMSTICAAISE